MYEQYVGQVRNARVDVHAAVVPGARVALGVVVVGLPVVGRVIHVTQCIAGEAGRCPVFADQPGRGIHATVDHRLHRCAHDIGPRFVERARLPAVIHVAGVLNDRVRELVGHNVESFGKRSERSAIAIAVDDVLDKKLDAIAAHESQVYEFGPWARGILDQVPEGEQERREFLWSQRKNYFDPTEDRPEMVEPLKKWYGAEKAATIRYAEPFEVADYGREPTDDEIRELFPMLPRT